MPVPLLAGAAISIQSEACSRVVSLEAEALAKQTSPSRLKQERDSLRSRQMALHLSNNRQAITKPLRWRYFFTLT